MFCLGSGDHDHLLFTTISFPNGGPVEAYGQPSDFVLQRSQRQFEVHSSVGKMLSLAVPRQSGENEKLFGPDAPNRTSHP